MNLTYFLGAGASANALPIVRNMDIRIGAFIGHLINTGLLSKAEENKLQIIRKEIESHYTIDTYAKKLFLKGRHAEKELFFLYNFMGAYFIYEQLRKKRSEEFCKFLYDRENTTNSSGNIYSSIIESTDYRYDSFYAALLKNDKYGNVYLPRNINIISWNYDFQLEISFMNFMINSGLDEVRSKLNIYPNPRGEELRDESSIIKINGTAGFYTEGKKYGDLFDFRDHILDRGSMLALKSVLFQERKKYDHSIYFAWNDDSITLKARNYAKEIIANTDILVVIGYSFPYFNRDADRDIFSLMGNTKGVKIYIQTADDTLLSVSNRAKGVSRAFNYTEGFIELDQFLIPNELT
jgi:hypothetical protein